MTSKPLETPARQFRVVAAMGDSLTMHHTSIVRPWEFWPYRVAEALGTERQPFRARNFGIGGDATQYTSVTYPGMRDRIEVMWRYGVPDIAVVWGGRNDAAAGFSANTTANLTAMAHALMGAGCERLVLCSTHYQNYTTVGDSTPAPAGAQATRWNAQKAAYDAVAPTYPDKVAWCDLYGFMRGILGTTYRGVAYAQGDYKWHVADLNTHLTAAGEQIVADAIMATITAQPGWLAALRA